MPDPNLIAAILHGAVGIGSSLWIQKSYDPQKTLISTQLLKNDGTYTQQDDWLLVKLILSFTFITALFHIALFSFRKFREGLLARENNYLRWLEYGITSSLMLAVIGFSVGVETLQIFILIIVLNLVMILAGHMVECYLRKDRQGMVLASSIAGWSCFAVIWYWLIRAFLQSTREATQNGAKIPNFVTAVVISMVFFFSLFGAVQLYHISHKGTYARIDRLYLLLSFLSKTALTTLLLGGVMGRNQD